MKFCKELLTEPTELVSVRCKYSNAAANALLLYLLKIKKAGHLLSQGSIGHRVKKTRD